MDTKTLFKQTANNIVAIKQKKYPIDLTLYINIPSIFLLQNLLQNM
jgi:hypothetical protein